MIKFSVISFLTLSTLICFAQDSLTDNILTTKKFRKGIYRTFNEFKQNNPYITTGYTVELDTGKYDRYKLYFNSGKKVRKVYGFSDGTNIYVNAKVYEQSNYFVPILVIGKILYFDDFFGKRNAKANASGLTAFGLVGGAVAYGIGNSAAKNNPGWLIYMPDDTGDAFILDHKSIISILQEEDPELLKKFKLEKDKGDYNLLLTYLLDFNKRHPAE